MKNVSEKSRTETRNPHFMFSNFFKNKIMLFVRYMDCRAGQATDDNMAHALCRLDT
jgi:hypothetical protein